MADEYNRMNGLDTSNDRKALKFLVGGFFSFIGVGTGLFFLIGALSNKKFSDQYNVCGGDFYNYKTSCNASGLLCTDPSYSLPLWLSCRIGGSHLSLTKEAGVSIIDFVKVYNGILGILDHGICLPTQNACAVLPSCVALSHYDKSACVPTEALTSCLSGVSYSRTRSPTGFDVNVGVNETNSLFLYIVNSGVSLSDYLDLSSCDMNTSCLELQLLADTSFYTWCV